MKKAQEMAGKMSGATSEILKNWKSLLHHLAKASGFMYINFSWISLYVLEFMYSKFILGELPSNIESTSCGHCCSALLGFKWKLIHVATF